MMMRIALVRRGDGTPDTKLEGRETVINVSLHPHPKRKDTELFTRKGPNIFTG